VSKPSQYFRPTRTELHCVSTTTPPFRERCGHGQGEPFRQWRLTEIRVLPPLVIARLGSSPEPLENYNLELPKDTIGFRKIVPTETFYIGADGSISRGSIPAKIVFRDADRIRPVAPFLELFARVDGDLVPLTAAILEDNRLSPSDVKWSVKAGHLKVFRRTGKDEDRVYASVGLFSDHDVHALEGECPNFVPGAELPLGSVRYINPIAISLRSVFASLPQRGRCTDRAPNASNSISRAM
jgi:hypothetical protein